MKCTCKSVALLKGVDAEHYMNEHLRLLGVDHNTREAHFECPDTGLRWVETYPYPAAHGYGPPELRRVDAPQDANPE
jgi:hypothetical protein